MNGITGGDWTLLFPSLKNRFPLLLMFSLLVLASWPTAIQAANSPFASGRAHSGEGPLEFLNRYGLDQRHLRAFRLQNGLKSSLHSLKAGERYELPVFEHRFTTDEIRTSLGVPMQAAVQIREFNARLSRAGQKPKIVDDRQIWVPFDQVLARAGPHEQVIDLLSRYALDKKFVSAFCHLNGLPEESRATSLVPAHLYRLPIHIRTYHGSSIQEALQVTRHDAVQIKGFNQEVHQRDLKPNPWDDHLVWVPYQLLDNPVYGPVYRYAEVISDQLRDCVFYLSPGHGGPDPGTTGLREGVPICEDEYAFDITLRLARELQRHGAKVEVSLRDEGIRDLKFLHCDTDELFQDGQALSGVQGVRLRQRVSRINKLYSTFSSQYPYQRFLALHIDFKADGDAHVDFDIYRHRSSPAGKHLAERLQDRIERTYASRLGGRDFVGEIKVNTKEKEFLVIEKTSMPAVLVELANINNDLDQLRFIVIDSRQRIAEWLCEGLIEDRETWRD